MAVEAWSRCFANDDSDAKKIGRSCLMPSEAYKLANQIDVFFSSKVMFRKYFAVERVRQPKLGKINPSNMLCSKCLPCLVLSFFVHSCGALTSSGELKYKAIGDAPQRIALYEAWFGESKHISVGYSTKNRDTIQRQIHDARGFGITGFVVDWYGDRDTYVDQSYAEIQSVAAKNKFSVAVMYDEGEVAEGATDQVIADLAVFHDTYLLSSSPGRSAYLMYQGRPIVFVFPHGNHTDWAKVRSAVNRWAEPPWLIQEYLPGPLTDAFDGFYPWINPVPDGWAADGSNWGDRYLADFYKNMADKHADKIIVGGAWPQFDDHRASWSLNRHISARCGQTYRESLELWKKYFGPGQVIPFMLVQTWNDYEEGSEVETGIKMCASGTTSHP